MIYSSDADPDELLYGSRIQIQGKRSNFVILGSWVWICIKITRIHITFLNMYKHGTVSQHCYTGSVSNHKDIF